MRPLHTNPAKLFPPERSVPRCESCGAPAQGMGCEYCGSRFHDELVVDHYPRGMLSYVEATGMIENAEVGQTLEVYRNVRHPGPVASKGNVAPFHRKRVGQVTIDHIYDDHFAHVTIAEGKLAKNDIVELRKD